MNNYNLLIQYDGTRYAGWQIQKNCDTVQQRITDVLRTLLKEEVSVTGSGRTDSGVHAFGQTANFKTPQDIDIYKFLHSVNCMLPTDIAVKEMHQVPEKFNARFDARKRTYIYLISKIKSPFYFRYSWFYHNTVDIKNLNNLSNCILGEHDFTSFSRKLSSTENKVCNIFNAQWSERKHFIIFLIEADRYLHGMVRTIAGTLLNADKLKLDGNYISDIFTKADRQAAGEAVPAKGLFLYKVKY